MAHFCKAGLIENTNALGKGLVKIPLSNTRDWTSIMRRGRWETFSTAETICVGSAASKDNRDLLEGEVAEEGFR